MTSPKASPTTLVLIHSAPDTLASLLFLDCTRHTSASGPLILQFSLFSSTFLDIYIAGFQAFLRSLFKTYPLNEVYFGHPIYHFNTVLDWMCLLKCWNIIHDVMAFGGGASGKWLGHKAGALMTWIGALIKETLESSLIPSTMWRFSEKPAVYGQGRGSHQIPNLLAPSSWTFQPSDLWEINFFCLYVP